MSILVTGGAGYIGSHVALALVERGERVVVVDTLATGHRRAVPRAARFVEGSAGDRGLLARLIAEEGVREVFHFAGSTVVPESCADPMAYYANNTLVSHTLIEAGVRAGLGAFVFSSSAAVYGAPEAAAVAEDAPLAPINPYGASKMMTERMLSDAGAAHALPHACLRYFNVAGADPEGRAGQSTPDATHLVKVAAQAAVGLRERLEIYGTDYPTRDGTAVRDYIHVSDLASAHLAALDHLRAGGASGAFNCGYGRGVTVREVVEAVGRAAGRPLETVAGPRRAGDPAAIVAVADRLRRVTGWRPRHDCLDAMVMQAIAWERRLAGLPVHQTGTPFNQREASLPGEKSRLS